MRLSGASLQGVLLITTIVCLVTLLLVYSFSSLRGQRDIDLSQAGSPQPTQTGLNTLARSEALKDLVRNSCKTLDFKNGEWQAALSHLLFDDTHKVIYCYIPKVACTSWRRVFHKLTGTLKPGENITSLSRGEVHKRHLPRLDSTKNPEEKLKTYKKFMFVRNPFERVLSAFRDKLEKKDELYDFHKVIGRKIEEKYRGTTKAGGHNITFSEFIRFISEPGHGTSEQRNEHWLPMHELCAPCSVEYDFIGRKENLQEDADYVLRWLGVDKLVDRFPEPSKPNNASQHVSKYMMMLTHKQRLDFYAKYLPDYALFDYKFL